VPQRNTEIIETLDSWKEIALFLRRGVRTVQRWERTEGLPVRRHKHLKRGSLYALPSELVAWQRARQLGFKVGKRVATAGTVIEELERLRSLTLRHAVLAKELEQILAVRGRIENFYFNGSTESPRPRIRDQRSRFP
jgi:hypothetical protein